MIYFDTQFPILVDLSQFYVMSLHKIKNFLKIDTIYYKKMFENLLSFSLFVKSFFKKCLINWNNKDIYIVKIRKRGIETKRDTDREWNKVCKPKIAIVEYI